MHAVEPSAGLRYRAAVLHPEILDRLELTSDPARFDESVPLSTHGSSFRRSTANPRERRGPVGAVAKGERVLVIDEINRADLARMLGEAVSPAGEDAPVIAKPCWCHREAGWARFSRWDLWHPTWSCAVLSAWCESTPSTNRTSSCSRTADGPAFLKRSAASIVPTCTRPWPMHLWPT